jgi:CRISPR/Cas system endoribonuclease Cas6 (RAMP superfamily)
MAVIMKRSDSWFVMLCSSERDVCFRGTYRLHLQCRIVSQARNQQKQAASLLVTFHFLKIYSYSTLLSLRRSRKLPNKMLYTFIISPMRAIHTAHLIPLDLIKNRVRVL